MLQDGDDKLESDLPADEAAGPEATEAADVEDPGAGETSAPASVDEVAGETTTVAGESLRGSEGRPDAVRPPTEAQASEDGDDGSFDLGAALADLRTGDIVRGHVVEVHADSVLVDVGYKSEGVIALTEYTYRHVPSASDVAHVGDEIEAMVLAIDRE
jgi:hypothetical protein